MLSVIYDVLASPTFRRFLVWVLTFLTVALNKKLGLELDAAQIASVIIAALAYLAQSALRQGKPAEPPALPTEAEALAIMKEKIK